MMHMVYFSSFLMKNGEIHGSGSRSLGGFPKSIGGFDMRLASYEVQLPGAYLTSEAGEEERLDAFHVSGLLLVDLTLHSH